MTTEQEWAIRCMPCPPPYAPWANRSRWAGAALAESGSAAPEEQAATAVA